MACDMRIASDRAVFTTAFARRGLIAAGAGATDTATEARRQLDGIGEDG